MSNYRRERIRWNARCLSDRRRRRIQMWQLAPAWAEGDGGEAGQENERPLSVTGDPHRAPRITQTLSEGRE